MAKVLMVVRILPSDSETDLNELAKSIVANLPKEISIGDQRVEEIGFGLRALVIGFLMPEAEGMGEALEAYLSSVNGVGEVDIQAVTRI